MSKSERDVIRLFWRVFSEHKDHVFLSFFSPAIWRWLLSHCVISLLAYHFVCLMRKTSSNLNICDIFDLCLVCFFFFFLLLILPKRWLDSVICNDFNSLIHFLIIKEFPEKRPSYSGIELFCRHFFEQKLNK